MGTLVGLLRAAINAALLNESVRSALLAGFTRSVNWAMQPSTSSKITAFLSSLMKPVAGSRPSLLQALFEGAFALMLLRLTGGSRILKLVAFSGVGAFLFDMLKAVVGRQNYKKKRQKDQIIDIDEYTVVEEKQ